MPDTCPYCTALAAANRAILDAQHGVDRAAATAIDALLDALRVQQHALDIVRDGLERMRATLRRDPHPEPAPVAP